MRRNQHHMLTDTNTEEQDKAFHKQTLGMEERWGQLKPSTPFETLWDRYLSSPRSKAQLKNRKRWQVAFSAFMILIAMGVTAVFTSPEVRAALAQFPFMKMLLKDGGFDDFGLSKIEKEHLGVQVDQSVTDKGIRFKMDEVFYDGVQIVLNYDVEYLDKKGKIDAKDASVYYHLDVIGADPTIMSTHKFTILKDHTFIGSTLIDAYQYLDGYQLHMKISQIGRVKGDWSVTVPLSVDKTSSHTKTFLPNKSFVINGIKRTVERITMTPVSTQLVIKSEDMEDRRLSYWMQDNLQTRFQGAGGLGGHGKSIQNFSATSVINPYPDYVEILVRENSTDSIVLEDQTEQTVLLDGHFPIELKGEYGGKVTITKVEYTAEGTTVYYEASDVSNQNPFLLLVDSQDRHAHLGQPIRLSRDKFIFKMKYPVVDTHSPVHVMLNMNKYKPGFEPQEPVKIKIPLDWSKP
ncbi:DUF4179 domain-containing protein [Paenibacillus dokdonensis]|uniref:DUF4179 domain-containing protein n=1 Tax=Paenibacillus dokdonensis TaxID=2567944 RepID=A0ABU6GRA4_9BACL|nr:DUF4179 domain-containing protein [Paenibacillus dokdonensis]MEC0242238.1 DUF4179 domain-containing protein [Paenibacillus dokdonensis]